MRIDERLRALNALPATEYERLVKGYARVANDVRMTRPERLRARRRLRLLQLSRVSTRPGEIGIN